MSALAGWVEREDLAAELDVTVRTLVRWASSGFGPPYVKIGRKVWYRRQAVDEWLRTMEAKGGPEWRSRLKT